MVRIKHHHRGGGINTFHNKKGGPLIRINPLHWFLVFVGICSLTILLATRSIHHHSTTTSSSHLSSPGQEEQDEYSKKGQAPAGQPPPAIVKENVPTNSKNDPRYFMVFSTGCTPFQNWQGIAFFYFAHRINQPGNITRITSGCTPSQAKEQVEMFDKLVRPLSDKYSIHITPDYGVHDNTKYWNKPNGLLDYLENVLGFPSSDYHKDDIVMIVDPDMMLLRPLTHRVVQHYNGEWKTPRPPKTFTVSHGSPIAQVYGFGERWMTSIQTNLSFVVGPDSPALSISAKEAGLYYPAGPPYLATGKDMYAIAKHWVEFLPRLHELFPKYMAEMHAYSAAAAHLQLKHHLAKGFMMSDFTAPPNLEDQSFLQNVTRKDACSGTTIPQNKLPFVLHYCQRYSLGRWFFSKYKLREDFFESCEAPLLAEPPRNVGEVYDWYVFPNGVEMNDYSSPAKQHYIIKHAWMLCTILFTFNEVATNIKQQFCESANFNKTWHFHNDTLFQAMKEVPSNPFQHPEKAMKVHGVDLDKVNKKILGL